MTRLYKNTIEDWKTLMKMVDDAGGDQIVLRLWQLQELLDRIEDAQPQLVEHDDGPVHTNLTDASST